MEQRSGTLRWFSLTLLLHLAAFTVPATVAWRDTLDASLYVPVVTAAAVVVVGLGLTLRASSRRLGLALLGATAVAVVLDLALTVLLVIAYGQLNPGWDLS